MTIPHSDILTTNYLGRIFKSTSATYKFFWFISILQIHAKTDNLKIDAPFYGYSELENVYSFQTPV